jgi:hypothetical protein
MQNWEYAMRYVSLETYEKDKKGEWKRINPGSLHGLFVNTSAIWDAPWLEKTEFEYIQEMGRQGWEMVSATPITGGILYGGGYTTQILFVLKRPLPELDQRTDYPE